MDGRFLRCGYAMKPCDPNHQHSKEVRSKSQMIGWLLILSLALFFILAKLLKSICSRRNYFEERFANIYKNKEANEIERISRKNANHMAVKNVNKYYENQEKSPRWWEKLGPSPHLEEHYGGTPYVVTNDNVNLDKTYKIKGNKNPIVGDIKDEEKRFLTHSPPSTPVTLPAENITYNVNRPADDYYKQ
ncbi:uncharacterized protein LOC135923608 [Gordionus sp. m RMFG-2023]|uniref:uncharacterized protein LOC135923608 n=1 Tax=Gordionus sp. m RMFG-2023 TaxID=3053472 RepID=UPI0031FC3B98